LPPVPGPHRIVLFHSALGLRPAVLEWADRLRAAGHTVEAPDSFDGEVFDDLDAGMRKRDEVGVPSLIGRANAAVADLPPELVYMGFSMGASAAEFLAATRPRAIAAVLMHGAAPVAEMGGEAWPAGVPVQVHHAVDDPWVEAAEVEGLRADVEAAGAAFEVFTYPGKLHLFADTDGPEFDRDSATLMFERVVDFLERI
jgi:dienelactone hydrolase